MGRWAFSNSCFLRQATCSLTVRSFNCFDSGVPVAVLLPPPPLQEQHSSSASSSQTLPGGAYKTFRRSAYSVLRSRNTPPGACAQNLLLSEEISTTSKMGRCCCAALLYRVTGQESAPSSSSFFSERDRERDDFVFSLKLALVERLLRDVVGEAKYEALVGPALTQAQQIGLCEELLQLSEDRSKGEVKGSWVARLLLTPEEDNRVKWLREDGNFPSIAFARAPSFKAMYVAYHIGTEEKLDVRHFKAIEGRMIENNVGWDMCDAAVVGFFAMRHKELQLYLGHVVRNILLVYGEDSANTELDKVPKASLRHVLGAMLLLKCFKQLQCEADEAGRIVAVPPICLFEAVTQLCSLVTVLPMTGELDHVLNILAKTCRESVLSLATMYVIPTGSPELPDFTLWMLREAPDAAVSHYHFRRMVQRNQAEAISLLKRSGLLSTKSIDLRVVMTSVLPLLDSCGHEEFFFVVIREVLVGLEERLRRDALVFTEDDLRFIAALGTRLFELPQQGGIHPHHSSGTLDATTRGQLEELQVMDGSPWALIAFSYGSLKEVVKALVRDHRRLKNHVGGQMRTIVEAVTADTRNACKKKDVFTNVQPTNTFVVEEMDRVATNSTASFGGNSSSIGLYAGATTPLRLSTPLSLRERFLTFLEELVKGLVDETGMEQQGCKIVSNELFAFVKRHVPIPNIHDEYRRKLFFLVNVFSDESSLKSGNSNNDPDDEIPAELRLLVTSLPLTLSSWASVMILREVLSESAGNNPRYTYVLNAAIDLQLPISTTRSRIATTLNMWKFLSSQADKLSVADQVRMKQRCVFNLPLSYVMSSYWSLLTWLFLITIVGLSIVGMDPESQYVATRLFREFAFLDDVLPVVSEEWNKEGAKKLVSIYLDPSELNGDCSEQQTKCYRSSSEVLLSSASYIFLGSDNQRRPMMIVTINSKAGRAAVERTTEEHACASAVLRELSQQLPFPFYLPITRELSMDLIISRAAERIRRVSFNNAWVISRAIFRIFPLGRYQTEHALVSNTCAQANLTRRRITFLLHIHHSVSVPPQLLSRLGESVLAQNGNLVVVVHEESLKRGGITSDTIRNLTEGQFVHCVSYNKQWALSQGAASSLVLEGDQLEMWPRVSGVLRNWVTEAVSVVGTLDRYVSKYMKAIVNSFSNWIGKSAPCV